MAVVGEPRGTQEKINRLAFEVQEKVAEADYMGAEFCGMYQADKYATWLETPHADAAGIEVANESGTWYYVAANAHRIYTEEDFLANCRDCHVTGWDEETQS